MNEFQRMAERRIREVLERHEIQIHFRTHKFRKWFSRKIHFLRSGAFATNRGKYEITIGEDLAMTMGEDEMLFECFLPREYQSDDILIECFSARLDRYLCGGPWEEPDEKDPGPVTRFFSKVFGWTKT